MIEIADRSTIQQLVNDGNPDAIVYLAVMIQNEWKELGTKYDVVFLLNRAIELGSNDALWHLGRFYLINNDTKIIEIIRNMELERNYLGYYLKAMCYKSGRCGLIKDQAQSLLFFKMAYDMGHQVSGINISKILLMSETFSIQTYKLTYSIIKSFLNLYVKNKDSRAFYY